MSNTYEELVAKVEELEDGVYDIPRCYRMALALHRQAWDVFEAVLGHYNLCYSNPGEPEAENADRSVVIPLTGHNSDMMTSEEESIQSGGYELPGDLYWARLRLQQAKDILEDGWQFGLEGPEVAQ